MSNQIVISSGAKVRSLEGVLTGTAGVVNSVPLGGANGVATLDSLGKVPLSQLPASVVTYLGTWNAATNTPTLVNGTGDTGDLYICNVAGTVNFGAGPITFAVGDWVIYSGTQWQKSSGATGTVTSVAVTESGDALTITGSPITTSGTINIGFAGTGSQYVKGDGTLATFPSIIQQATKLITEVYNETGATLSKGTVVYINGGHGNLPTVTKALATSDATSAQTYGVVQSDITNNNNGYVVVIGSLGDLDTQAYANGTQLYLSSTTAGAYTSTKQYAPAHLVYVGIVTRSHPTQGVIEVKIQNGYELDELHNVSAQNPNNNDILQYDSSTSLWEAKSIATALGYTPANAATYVPYSGATTDVNLGSHNLTTTGDINAGGVTSWAFLATPFTGDTGYLFLQSGTTTFNVLGGVSAIFANGNKFGFNPQVGGGSTFKQAYLDFGSLTNNTTRNYAFPDASGTLALTSNLSSYVPYTGATSSVNLGTNNTLTAHSLFTTATAEGGLFLTQNSAITGSESSTTYSSIKAYTNRYMYFSFGQSTALKRFRLDVNGLTDNTTLTYTMPNASGTLALTSDISYPVTSVFGRTGAVTAQSGDYTTTQVTEGTNLYYTDARARGAISLTTTGTSGAATYNSTTGVLNIPQYQGGVTSFNTRTGAVTLTSSDVTGALGYTPADDSLVVKLAGVQTISGAKTFSNNVRIDNGSGSAFLGFKQYASGSTGISGFTSIYAISTDTFAISFGAANDILFKTASPTFPRTYTFPNNSGTVALTSDIPSLSGYVDTTTNQTVGGFKTFSAGIFADAGILINNASTAWTTGYIGIGATTTGLKIGVASGVNQTLTFPTGTSYTYTFPSATGTLALTTDLSSYVPTSRTLTINGVTYDLSANRSWTVSSNVNATNTQDFTATAGQTTFTVTGGYTVGQLAVYYNGSKLAAAEYTATNGTTFTLATACQVNDIVQAVVAVTGGGIGGSGTTNYISKWSASGVLGNSLIYDDGTNVGIGTNAPFSGIGYAQGLQVKSASNNAFVRVNSGSYTGIDLIQLTDGNASLFLRDNGYIQFGTNNTERMRITSAGGVGIGTSNPSFNLSIIGGSMALQNNASNYSRIYFTQNSSESTSYTYIDADGRSSGYMAFRTNDTERMRITSGGCVYVGTTSVPSGATDANAGSMYVADNVYVGNSSGTAGYACKIDGYNNSLYVIWQNTTGGTAGGVALSYGATSWSPVSSDERTKKNFETTQGLEEILQIEPVKYHLLSDEDDSVKRLGFKAQNIQPLIPEMVHETGRQLEDGSEILTITPDYLLPVLVKAIQEQQDIINNLTQRLETLENK